MPLWSALASVSNFAKKAVPMATNAAKNVIGAARYASNIVDKGRSIYNNLGDGEKTLINNGLKALMNKAGPEKTQLLSRGLQTGSQFLDAVKKDGDNMVRKINEVERVSQMSPAEQARTLGEAARNVDLGKLKEDLQGPIDRLRGAMS